MGFKNFGVDTYDGKANPAQRLTLYEIAMRAAGRSKDVMTNYLPVKLNQFANNWLSLWEDSIRSWDDLKKVFTENYMATYEQLGTKYDLEKLHQTSGEPLHGFIRLFSETRNSIPNISDGEAITAFTKGLHHEQLRGKLYARGLRPSVSCCM
jgi:hypothetical protein